MDWLWVGLLVVIVAGITALAYWRPTLVTVFEFERGLRYRAGRFVGSIGPGQHWISGRTGRITKVDVRPTLITVPGQELITSDGIAIKVSLLATIEVTDPATAINKAQNYVQAIYAALQVGLRQQVAGMTIENLLADRSMLGKALLEETSASAAEIGVTLSKVDVRDVMLPGDLKRAFSQELTARKEAAATLEKTRGETAALRNLANAARMVQENPALYQLRLLQMLGGTGGNTVVLGNLDGVPIRPQDKPKRREGTPPKVEESN